MAFIKEKHVQYVKDLDSETSKQSYEYWLTEHLRLNGLYWGITSLVTMKYLDALPQDEVISFIMGAWDQKNGGFGSFHRHDAHILSTLSAIQILSIYGKLDLLGPKRELLVRFIKGLQLPNGSFQGDKFGEIDTRFVYTALSSLSILGELTSEIVNPAVDFIMKCQNFDGGFGMVPGAESHAAQVFTSLGALAITDRLHLINEERVGSWLSERQVLPSGGMNGRPEKLPDVCYSWWAVSSLAIIGKKHWINAEKLQQFILRCQDAENGGFSDREGNQTDVFHTCFGIAGLALLDHEHFELNPIDPVYCMPLSVTKNFKKWK
ncbi:uncharacterized protein PRCAT00004390001 [Priceomyces carsonii]|uniref:uncharacterized protein n=1 Tax=Priceomyces carsonii TaxID=28549 RepID=UPI002EDA9346|nr:unnamed protein product [Priceomyces carsonii]